MSKYEILEFSGEYAFLSNFYPCNLVWKGKHYRTSEHTYQAAKAITEEDHELVRNSKTAGEAKKNGRKIKMRPDFENRKLAIMKEILLIKFSLPELRDKLLATGEAKLVEGNTWGDQEWGQVDGVGKNYLGKILMEIRDEIP
jgi:ribA/ribD-fused uncharacterized protein